MHVHYTRPDEYKIDIIMHNNPTQYMIPYLGMWATMCLFGDGSSCDEVDFEVFGNLLRHAYGLQTNISLPEVGHENRGK